MLAQKIKKYGVLAVMGREMLGAGEIRRMDMADMIIRAWNSRDDYHDKDGNANWVEWAAKYPELSRVLIDAEKIADKENG